MEKGASSYRRERFLTSQKRPLYLKIIVSTPLSIRRGGGGGAVDGLGVRLLFYFKQIFEALLPTRTMYVPGVNEMCISAVAAFAR